MLLQGTSSFFWSFGNWISVMFCLNDHAGYFSSHAEAVYFFRASSAGFLRNRVLFFVAAAAPGHQLFRLFCNETGNVFISYLGRAHLDSRDFGSFIMVGVDVGWTILHSFGLMCHRLMLWFMLLMRHLIPSTCFGAG